ncbi:helix-turn-helix transcriptional regulator [Variovorax sp. EL159]|uniref:helix-turn-helix transcriptional regulator n=1 Tax=Variovorax sp. EL159 TaxID=1566270 RepID=UPI0008844FE3|nr:helix-turn-helix transcriptional regulator [Variovorax sp. EL159]SCX73845.1 regulatory protein, luxR family [Variovorax sp. EL159]
MQAMWRVPAVASQQVLDLQAVSLLLDVPRDVAPARAMLHFLNALLPVAYISLVRHAPEAPMQLEGHAYGCGVRNVTHDCFAQYRRHFYSFDDATHIAAHMGAAPGDSNELMALQLHADDIPDPGWRHQIYQREHLSDRLALLYTPMPRGSAFSINLYRSESMGRFGPQEIERVLAVAPLLRQVHRHALGTGAGGLDMDTRIALARARLDAAPLSGRERDVCARIACGITADGIAADLGIAPSSVHTLRKRAYAKLAINDRAALVRLAG